MVSFSSSQLLTYSHSRYKNFDLSTHILSFLNEYDLIQIAKVNRQWLKHTSSRKTLPQLFSEKYIPGSKDHYEIKRRLHRDETEEILRQTGLIIPIHPGESYIENFTLGRGAFGEFCIGFAIQKAHYVGIKITLGNHAVESEAAIQRELSQKPHIMPALDSYKAISPDGKVAFYQVMDLAGLGSIDKLKTELAKLDKKFKEQILFCFADGLLQGLNEMHLSGICHLDIKPENIAVQHNGNIRLIDFGCAAMMKDQRIDVREENGDTNYFSPERWLDCRATTPSQTDGVKIDAWAAGLTLLVLSISDYNGKIEELFIGMKDLLTSNNAEQAIFHYIQDQLAKIPNLKDPAPDTYEALILELLNPDPATRLSPSMALQHPWCQKIRTEHAGQQRDVIGHLREFVQVQQRSKKNAIKSDSPLSPQDLPLPHFTSFVERPDIQTQLEKILFCVSLPTYFAQAPILACQGIGGVGKSQLLTYMIHTRKIQNHFGLRLWFRNADNKESVTTQYLALAKELCSLEDRCTTEDALDKLKEYLAGYPKRFKKPWLAVFDNAEEYQQLAPFLPKNGGYIIVTTRTSKWKDILPIDVFTPKESVALAKKLLLKTDIHIPELCKELGYLPLGIEQACAYIRNQQISIPAYLELLRKNATLVEKNERLFGKELPHTILSLWQTTFETIKSINQKAYQLLEILSFFGAENLTQQILSKFSLSSEQDLLKRYAMLQIDNKGTGTIHRLIQLAIITRQTIDKQIENLAAGMDFFLNALDTEDSLKAEQANKSILDHGETLLKHHERLSSPRSLLELWVKMVSNIDSIDSNRTSKRKVQLEQALIVAKEDFGQDHVIVGEILLAFGSVRGNVTDIKNAIVCCNQALNIFVNAYGDDHFKVANSLVTLGHAQAELGEANGAIPYYERAVTIHKKNRNRRDLAAVLNSFGIILNEIGQGMKATSCYEEALVLTKEIYGHQHSRNALLLNNMGAVWAELDAKKAIFYFNQALAINKKIYGEKDPNVAGSLHNLGGCYMVLGEYQQSLKFYNEALDMYLNAYGSEDSMLAPCLNDIGQIWQRLGQAKNAIPYYTQALNIRKVAYGETHPQYALSLCSLGLALCDLGNHQEAIRCHKAALAIRKKAYGDIHFLVARSLNNLAMAYRFDINKENKEIGLKLALEALDVNRKILKNMDHSEIALSLENVGAAYYGLNDAQKAKDFHEQALVIYNKIFQSNHPQVITCLNNIGLDWRKIGNAKKAMEYFEQAMKACGDDHYFAGILRINIAEILNEAEKTIPLYETALVILRKTLGPESLETARCLCLLANVRNKLGDIKNAIQNYELAFNICIKIGEHNPVVVASWQNLAQYYSTTKDFHKLLQCSERALALFKTTLGEEHTLVAGCLASIGMTHSTIGDFNQSIQFLEKAYPLYCKLREFGENHEHTQAIRLTLIREREKKMRSGQKCAVM